MRPSDEMPLNAAALAELEAIDATLAGEAVDPSHAELAELALLLASDRPLMREAFGQELDRRLERRFETPGVAARRRRPIRWRPLLSTSFAAVVAGAVAVIVLAGGASPNQNVVFGSGRSASSGAFGTAAPAHRAAAAGASTSTAASSSTGLPAPSPQGLLATPSPSPNGRKQVRSGNLQLVVAGDRIEAVAQELFDVVGQENGIVQNSQISQSGESGGYAWFSLSIPSANLPETMARLSQLRSARVVSRTDSSQDVTDEYARDQRRLADARALRTALLKQLAAATTAAEVESLKAQIRDAEASISSDEATLRGLQHRIGYSALSVQINAAAPVPRAVAKHSSGGGGFTIGRAGHDALRVLEVAAGVILIVLAGLVPVGLLGLLAAWITLRVRRHRREHALDAA